MAPSPSLLSLNARGRHRQHAALLLTRRTGFMFIRDPNSICDGGPLIGVILDPLDIINVFLVIQVRLADDAPPHAAPHTLLLREREDHDDGQKPDGGPE